MQYTRVGGTEVLQLLRYDKCLSVPLSTDKTKDNLKQGLRGNSNHILSCFVQLGTRQ